MTGGKIFMGSDSNSINNNLYNEYNEMINRVAENGYFTPEDLEIYYKVGKFMSSEKSRDERVFDESIPPYFLLYILSDN